MFHATRFPEIAAAQHSQRAGQKRFLQLAHAIERPIQQELRAFARAIWHADPDHDFISGKPYRLRKETRPGQASWWIEKDIPPSDRYRCAAYRVDLCLTATGENKLSVQSGQRKYPVDLNNLSALHDILLRAGDDPALIIPRRMGAALDP